MRHVSTHRTTCSYHYQEPWKETIIGETSSVFCGQDMRPVGALNLSQTFWVLIVANELSRIRF
jgi:hypothetical protein